MVSRWLPDGALASTPVRVSVAGTTGTTGTADTPESAIELVLSPGDRPARMRFLFFRGLCGLLMQGTDRGPAMREGLAWFLAAQALAANALGVPDERDQPANHWMESDRPDYVNGAGADGDPEVRAGCAVLFLYFLFTQLRYSVPAIAAGHGPDLAALYRDLSGEAADPFPAFRQLLDSRYPGRTTILGTHPDNPWPIGNLVDDVARGIDPLPVMYYPAARP
jgi:hypothetical protein